MKLFTIGTLFVLLALGGRASAAPDCATATPIPSGPSEVIACAAQQYSAKVVPPKSPALTATQFWNTVLFNTKISDGFCNGTAPAALQKAQLAMYNAACGTEKGTYFSYANFLAADAEISAKLGGAYTFMRKGTKYEVRLQEFANFLATAAQETTKGDDQLKYTTDGLYFRYENGILQSTDPQWNPIPKGACRDVPANPDYTAANQSVAAADCRFKELDTFIPEYYPISTFSVAVKGTTVPPLLKDYLVNTSLVMDNADKYDTNSNTIENVGTPTLYAGGTYAAPAGYTWQYMNQIIDPGYWIGMGNLQLTGVSMVQFFGWYHQKISAGAPVAEANYQAFVTRYLTEGKLAWEGGLWYWNYRINGIGKPNLHSVLAGPKPACHDIAITTKLVNGGCNDTWARDQYYNYFKTTVFGLCPKPVTPAPPVADVSSYICNDQILAYCTQP